MTNKNKILKALRAIKDLYIEDGIFRGTATFKDGTPFNFDITREEVVQFLIDHRKGKLVYDKEDGRTLLPDGELVVGYVQQSERLHLIKLRKLDPNPRPHGGPREGAGRKPKDKVVAQHITVTIRRDYLEIIKQHYPNNRSEFIQKAVRNQLRREELI